MDINKMQQLEVVTLCYVLFCCVVVIHITAFEQM